MTRRETKKQDFIREVSYPGQSEGLTKFLGLIANLDDQTFEVFVLPALARGDLSEEKAARALSCGSAQDETAQSRAGSLREGS